MARAVTDLWYRNAVIYSLNVETFADGNGDGVGDFQGLSAKLPYLAPNYGTVAWGVEGVYRHYTGWYDFNPVRLNPDKSAVFHRAVLEASGGAENVIKRGRQAVNQGQPQLAVELMNIILSVEPKHAGAHAVCADAYQKLAEGTVNTIALNIYRTAAQEHKKLAEKPPAR